MADGPRDQDELIEDADTEFNRNREDAVRGREGVEDVDPDSAESDIERDDSA